MAKIRSIGDVVPTSKLIDGTFRSAAIPSGNDKELVVDKGLRGRGRPRLHGVERAGPRKLSLSSGKLILSVTNPDSGSATRRSKSTMTATRSIWFQLRYLLTSRPSLTARLVLRLGDRNKLIGDKDAKGSLYVLMLMRV